MTNSVSLLNVNRVHRLGDDVVNALADFSYDFPVGEIMVIAGPSGSGKSTLLNIIGCIDKPNSGRVVIDGEDVTELSLEALSRVRLEKIGFIFQQFNLVPVLTAYENVELPLLFRKMPPSEARQSARNALDAVGLSDRMDHRPAQLSGGQRQRVAIARALAGNPRIVVADEPTASLDSKTAQGIVSLLIDLNQNFKATILVATHDQTLIENSSKTLSLRDGRIV